MKNTTEVVVKMDSQTKELITMLGVFEDVKRTNLVLKHKIDDMCRDHTCTSKEARDFGINRGGYVASLLGAYKEYLEKENQ